MRIKSLELGGKRNSILPKFTELVNIPLVATEGKTMPNQPDPHRFVFQLDKAIRDQVLETLDASPLIDLVKDCAPNENHGKSTKRTGAANYQEPVAR